jgi:putative ABC transport system permease protein
MYIIDINKSQLDRVKEIVGQSFQQFTVVRGRLVRINTTDLTKSEDPGITREFSMTYRNYVLEDEKIVRGVWHGDGVKNSVSIDSEFAKEIGARVGDEIEVFVQGISIEVIITSIRETSRSNGTPFFYLVFSEDVLSNFPATYFGTISVPADSLDTISTNLGLEFPNITTIETLGIFETVQVFIRNIVLVIKVLGIPSIVLGLLLILIMTAQSLYERKNDVLIFRAFGYSVQSIHRLFVTETLYTILGASVFAYIVSNAIAYMLNIFVFDFSDFVFSSIPIYIIIAITVCIILFSYGISKQITKISLKKLLSEK